MHKHKLISEVVDQGICIGCGVCAGVCPGKNIDMIWSENGELNPYIEEGCAPEICVCINACPILNAIDTNLNKVESPDHTSFHSLIGSYNTSYLGHVNNSSQRENSSSGGMLTWMLEELLTTKAVDGIITVVDSDTPQEGLFKFEILRSSEDLQNAAGSKYYPVEISQILKWLKKDKSTDVYALVGLPCLLKGVENACQLQPKLAAKIKYTFALTCGQLPNRSYTESLAGYSGISLKDLSRVNYRSKENTSSASNFVFKAEDDKGKAGKPLYWIEQPSYLWENSFFIHGACKFCDDIFGRTADAIFMDAWLPQYASDPKGHSIVVVKNDNLNTMVSGGMQSNKCSLQSIAINDVLESQRDQIIKKTELLAANLYRAEKNGLRITKRSVQASKNQYKRFKRSVELQWKVMIESKRKWKILVNQGKENEFFSHIDELSNEITRMRRMLYIKQGLQKLTNSPLKTFKRVVHFQLIKLFNKGNNDEKNA